MDKIKIRYNTDVCDGFLYWRVIINGKEHLASDIKINVPSYSTSDFVENVGIKHHISCESDNIVWNEETKAVTIN
jgi:hypothetical protein